jgi:hypothetical protein
VCISVPAVWFPTATHHPPGADVDFTQGSFTTACDVAYGAGQGVRLTFSSRYGDLEPVKVHQTFDLVSLRVRE